MSTAWIAALLSLMPSPAEALHYLEPEEAISELLVERPSHGPHTGTERTWALVPQVGYGPETSFVAGIKFTNRDLWASGATFDVDGVYAIEGQKSLTLSLASPSSLAPNFPIIVRASYKDDPRRRFYGLGNNTKGPDPASRHEMERLGGDVTLGWRVIPNLSFNVQAGGWSADIGSGKKIDHEPPTGVRFPDLPGIEGGRLAPLAASLVYDDRHGITRPTHGLRVLLKGSYDIGEFHFGRVIGDVSYLYPLFDEELVLGARLNGQYLLGPFDQIPFWALADLGGEDTLRGYFPYRFLGTSSVLGTVEARAELVAFDFFNLWHVMIDGVAFGEVGRVFIDNSHLDVEGGNQGRLRQTNHLPVSYGGGIRFALSDAILARVDVGFSDEETALVYLTFGHTF